MNEYNSIEVMDKTILSEQTKFEFKIIFIKRLIKENHAVKN